MGARDNRELLQYFKNRSAWMLQPDVSPLRLEPLPASSTQADADHAASSGR